MWTVMFLYLDNFMFLSYIFSSKDLGIHRSSLALCSISQITDFLLPLVSNTEEHI